MENEKTEEKLGKKLLDEYRTKKLRARTNFNVETPQKVISDALSRDYPRMPENTRHQVARMLVLQPTDRKIKIGNEEMSIGSLEARIAESIETINCGTSSKEEYHDWINTGQAVISDMNTDGVTPQELDVRNDFLKDLDQREVELMTCLGLYQRSIASDPKVQAKYNELYTKLQKLREIRSAVKNSTKNVADKLEKEKELQEKQRKEEQEKQKVSEADRHLMIAAVGALSVYDRLTKQDKQDLNMYHEKDFEHMNFHSYLSNYFLYNGDIRFNNKNMGEEQKYEASPLEGKLLNKYDDKKSVAHHIEVLTGRKQAIDNTKGVTVDKERYNNRGTFDSNNFNRIFAMKKARGLV